MAQAENLLAGMGASVAVATVQDGNELRGSFRLGFQDRRTRPLPPNVSSQALESAIRQDLGPAVVRATVVGDGGDRSSRDAGPSPTTSGNDSNSSQASMDADELLCVDGKCPNGPTGAGGRRWYITIASRLDPAEAVAPILGETDACNPSASPRPLGTHLPALNPLGCARLDPRRSPRAHRGRNGSAWPWCQRQRALGGTAAVLSRPQRVRGLHTRLRGRGCLLRRPRRRGPGRRLHGRTLWVWQGHGAPRRLRWPVRV